MNATTTVAVIGLGAAGSVLAHRLSSAGASVIGYDIKPPTAPPVPLADSVAEAVSGADLVLSVNTATAAYRVAEHSAPHVKDGALYADLNTGNPGLKERMAALLPAGAFVDVAIMSPLAVDDTTPLIAAGPEAKRLAELLSPLGIAIDPVSETVGDAGARELTRSLMSKFIASAIVDYLWTAQAMGLDEWAFEEMLREFDAMDAESAKRLMNDVVSNPKRREIEMLDIIEMLDRVDHKSLFVPATQLVYNKVYHSIKVPHAEE